jgi:hypothetical protein
MPRGFVLLMAALVLIAAIAVVLIATSAGGSNNQTASHANATRFSRAAKPAFGPRSITVAVLNGTATTGLAHRTAVRLSGLGFKEGPVVNASDQTHTSTIVAYTSGHRQQALDVASSLKLNQAAVQPVDQSTQEVACPPPAPCAATVIVTVGTDLATG